METVNLEPTQSGYARMRQMFAAEKVMAEHRLAMAEGIVDAIDGGSAYGFSYQTSRAWCPRDLDPDLLRAAMQALVEKESGRIEAFNKALEELGAA